jgi:hypothetical protein
MRKMRSILTGFAIALLWACSSSAQSIYDFAPYVPYYYRHAHVHHHGHIRAHHRVNASHGANSTGEVPTLDVAPLCHGITDQSDLQEGFRRVSFDQCIEAEQGDREQIKKEWSEFTASDKQHCTNEVKMGGESSYTELLTCLEMARDVRVLRSAAAAPKPASSLSTPTRPATSTEAAAPVVPPASRGRSSALDLDQAKGEAERAKADAEVAKASEALAQHKLADAEAALRRVSEELEQAKAEAERAKADAQGARESEAALKRKLADAETARVAAEEKAGQSGDTTRPGLGGRLRRWFGRPSAPNP